MSIKDIQYGEIEDFLLGQGDLSSKTEHNLKSVLHNFFTWLLKRRVIRKDQLPEFPEISFELGWRRTVDKDTQEKILNEIYRLCWDRNPRVYIGIRWAATYINIRPGELLGVLEEDVDLEQGIIIIRDHKTVRHTMRPKLIPLLPEDIDIVKSLTRGFPKQHFFRRDRGGGGRIRRPTLRPSHVLPALDEGL